MMHGQPIIKIIIVVLVVRYSLFVVDIFFQLENVIFAFSYFLPACQ